LPFDRLTVLRKAFAFREKTPQEGKFDTAGLKPYILLYPGDEERSLTG
jgi:hypothetical protein